MFRKKIRCKCGKKIDSSYLYCPYCGYPLKEAVREEKMAKEQRRQLDKELDRLTKELSESFGMPFIASFPFKIFVRKISRDIEKQFRELDQEMARARAQKGAKETTREIIQDGQRIGKIKELSFPGGHGFSIQINMTGVPHDFGGLERQEEKSLKPSKKLTKEEAKKLAKLPRQEPETSVRRLTDKIIYEIALPGVKDEKDVYINKLENSIEIKAFAKDKAYFKLIPLALPIKHYRLEDEKLILELKP
ncbi:MAG: zinc ribbon domain-containing protein [Candidatus Pacearchaeota archaeon]|nr:zinc ribbon domain-containing protein [Candidatus Pacearchaeota archaeon]